MKKRFTEEQIVFALKQAETGVPIGEITRKMGVSEPTFYPEGMASPPMEEAICWIGDQRSSSLETARRGEPAVERFSGRSDP